MLPAAFAHGQVVTSKGLEDKPITSKHHPLTRHKGRNMQRTRCKGLLKVPKVEGLLLKCDFRM